MAAEVINMQDGIGAGSNGYVMQLRHDNVTSNVTSNVTGNVTDQMAANVSMITLWFMGITLCLIWLNKHVKENKNSVSTYLLRYGLLITSI